MPKIFELSEICELTEILTELLVVFLLVSSFSSLSFSPFSFEHCLSGLSSACLLEVVVLPSLS